jgi:large subunit ribosomal protein L32
MQRAANMRIDFANLPGKCASCGEPKASHRVCPSCGKYGEKQIIPVVEN